MGLAIEYAKARGLNTITDKALEYAYETLGIEQEEEEYTGGGIYGMKNAFSPKSLMQSLGRNVLSNAATKAISGSGLTSLLGPVGLIGGALMLGRAFDPTRPGSRNYNPALAGQLADLGRRGIIGHDPNTGIYGKIMSGPLKGKNLISMFGPNDYGTMMDNKLGYFTDRIAAGKNFSQQAYEDTLVESGAGGTRGTKTGPVSHAAEGIVSQKDIDDFNKDGDGGKTGGGKTGGQSSADKGAGMHGDGKAAMGGRAGFDFSKGGIAGINRNIGQLGETLYG